VMGIAAGAQHTLLLADAVIPVPRFLNPAWQPDWFSATFRTLVSYAFATSARCAQTFSKAATYWSISSGACP